MVTTYSFGEWLKHRRKELRLAQWEVGAAAYCSRTMIKKIEADERRPSVELARLLAGVLLIPDDQVEIFIECARGLRPVDHLPIEPAYGWQEKIVSAIILPASLPLPPTPLIGRQAEMENLNRLLSESWLITIVGPGGVGKTRLALAMAAAWQQTGGQAAFVSLAELNEARNIVTAVNKALGLPHSPHLDPTEQLLNFLRHRTLLLVMDNFEHLLDGVNLLAQMRQASPGLTLLVTSRQRLNLSGEQMFPLEGLLYPRDIQELSETAEIHQYAPFPAVQLFLDNARRLIPDYTPQDKDALIELCRITEGMPLALELAAALVDTLMLSELVSEMRHNLDVLAQTQPHHPDRHHSIRIVFDTTWRLLTNNEQWAFAQTAIFRGGFTRQAAASVGGVTLPHLSALINRHLVRLDYNNGRYASHELMRQYGLEKLNEFGQLDNTYRKHVAFYLEQARTANANLRGSKQIDWLNYLDNDQDNFHAALTWSLLHAIPDAAQLALALGWYWRIRNYIIEGRWWLAKLLKVNIADATIEAELYFQAGHMAWMQGDYSAARHHQETSERLWQSLGDKGVIGLAYASHALGMVANQEDKLDKAQHHLETSLQLFEQCRDEWGIAFTQSWLGLTMIKQGNLERSQELLGKSLATFHRISDQWAKGLVLIQLSFLERKLRNWDKAYELADEASQIAGKLGHWHSLGTAWNLMAQIVLEHGNLEKARQLFQESLKIYTDMGNERMAAELQEQLDSLSG